MNLIIRVNINVYEKLKEQIRSRRLAYAWKRGKRHLASTDYIVHPYETRARRYDIGTPRKNLPQAIME